MPTIKRKVEMNLPQLIEWGWKNINKVQSEIFISNVSDFFGNYSTVHFSVDGYCFKTDSVSHKDTFTVEVEEPVTKNTVIPKLLTTFKKTYLKYDFGYQRVRIDEDFKIQLMLNKAEAHREEIETLHMVNDDGTHTLLWRDGKLVD